MNPQKRHQNSSPRCSARDVKIESSPSRCICGSYVDEEEESLNAYFARPRRGSLLYQRVEMLERGVVPNRRQPTDDHDDDITRSEAYGRKVPSHIKAQELNLTNLIQAQEQQCALDDAHAQTIDAFTRATLYKLLLQEDDLISKNPGVYEQLLHHPVSELELRADIAKDVDRTFTEHEFFSDGQIGQVMLYRVLSAYAAFNPEIGYCQGMNVLVAVLLLAQFSEEEAFWAFTHMLREYSLESLFMPGLVGVKKSIKRFGSLFEALLPKLKKHFDHQGIEVSMFFSKWLMTLYASVLPLRLVCSVWVRFLSADCFDVLLSVGLAILHTFQDTLLVLPFEEILLFIQALPISDLEDPNALLASAEHFTKRVQEAKATEQLLVALI